MNLLKKKKKTKNSEMKIILTPPIEKENIPLMSEISTLKFLMSPRILYLSLKNETATAYIFQLTLVPKTLNPFVENFIFEWKNLNNFKTVRFFFLLIFFPNELEYLGRVY